MAFDTSLLDAAVVRRQAAREHERQTVLGRVLRLLDQLGPEYGVCEAYIFGSVTRTDQFSEHSDVDIAVEHIAPDQLFDVIGTLSMALRRDVDLVELRKCHFADRIREAGIRWTKQP